MLAGPSLWGLPVYRSSLIKDGNVLLMSPQGVTRFFVATHDRTGHFLRFSGEKWPLYSRYDLGMREMARDRRRAR